MFDFDQLRQRGSAALKTMEASGLASTCARWSNLAGGLVLIAIGAVLLLCPEWLSFS